MCFGKVYLQSMIMVSVSLSLASWNGAAPHTSIYRITPKDQMSERVKVIYMFQSYLLSIHINHFHKYLKKLSRYRTRLKGRCQVA